MSGLTSGEACMSSREFLRVAVVGTGGIFMGAHLRAYPELKDAALVGFYDVVRSKAEYAAKRYREMIREKLGKAEAPEERERLNTILKEIKVYSNLEELAEDEGIDIIDVCTPPKWHDEVAIPLIKSKHNVMVEKPMARTWIESNEVVKAVKESGVLYQHNENWVYSNVAVFVKKLIESGIIGDLISVTITFEHNGPEWKHWFWDPFVDGGGTLIDMGTHAITAIWFLVGFDKKPCYVKSCCMKVNFPIRYIAGHMKRINVDDYANIKIIFEDRRTKDVVIGNAISSWCSSLYAHRDILRVEGSEGSIRMEYEEGKAVLILTTRGGGMRKVPIQRDDSFANEIRNFVNCVKYREKSITDETIGSETMAIIGAAYLSELEERRLVALGEFKEYAGKYLKEAGNYKEAADMLIRDLMKPYRAI